MRHNGLCSLSNKWHEKELHSFKWKQEALQLRRYFKTSKFILKNQKEKIHLAKLSSNSADKE